MPSEAMQKHDDVRNDVTHRYSIDDGQAMASKVSMRRPVKNARRRYVFLSSILRPAVELQHGNVYALASLGLSPR